MKPEPITKVKDLLPNLGLIEIEEEIEMLEAIKVKFPHRTKQANDQIDLYRDMIHLLQN